MWTSWPSLILVRCIFAFPKHVQRQIITSHDSSKEQVCHQIGAHVLIDDDVRHLRDVRLEGLRRVWLQHGRTQIDDCPVGVAFCSHWDKVLGVLGVSG